MQDYDVEIFEEDGMLCAQVVELPGVFASGSTWSELEEALTESIGLVVEAPAAAAMRLIPSNARLSAS